MKFHKLLKMLSAVVLACVLCASFAPMVAMAAMSDSLLLVLDKGEMEGNRVEIVATLTKNTGTTGLILTLTYDDNALELVEVSEGSALSELSCTRTPTYTTPYKILYTKERDFYENDFTKGILLKFVFEIKDLSHDGTYKVTLKADKNAVQYADGDQFKTKNLLSNPTTITVKGEQTTVEVLPTEDDVDKGENDSGELEFWQILVIVILAGVLVIVLMAILVLKRGKVRKK